MFCATITFFGPNRNGRNSPPLSGYQPQLLLGDVLTSCVIEATDGTTTFTFDQPYTVVLRLMFPREYGDRVANGMTIRLFEGSRCVGEGLICEGMR
jgi:hypothetical protein